MTNGYEQYNTEPASEVGGGFDWKTVGIIIGAVVIAIVIVIVAVMIVRNVKNASELRNQQNQMIEQAELSIINGGDECDTTVDPEACRLNLINDVASKTSAVQICNLLEGEQYSACVIRIAHEQNDPNECEALDGKTAQEQCYDEVLLSILVSEGDYQRCSELKRVDSIETCWSMMEGFIARAGECEEYGVDMAACSAEAVTLQAITTRNPDLCTPLEEQYAESCHDRIAFKDIDLDDLSAEFEEANGMNDLNPDIDADGLNDGEELSMGTDPFNPDTDNDGLNDGEEVNVYGSDPLANDTDADGYSDGAEVAAGYSPVGAGTL